MENATKALLIAAAVLIAIVLVALGVNLLSGVGDTTGQAEQVGSALEDGRGSVADKITDSLKGTMTVAEAKAFLQGIEEWPESSLDYLETRYEDYSFRVYKKDSGAMPDYSDKLWNNSEVIKKIPSGYEYKAVRQDDDDKRYIIIIAPES